MPKILKLLNFRFFRKKTLPSNSETPLPPQIVAYRTDQTGRVSANMHFGTKRAAIERAIDIAALLPLTPEMYEDLPNTILEMAKEKNDNAIYNELSQTIFFKTVLTKAVLKQKVSFEICDTAEQDRDWAGEALSSIVSERIDDKITCIDMLFYKNKCEDAGSISYYLVNEDSLLESSHIDLYIVIQKSNTKNILEYIDEALININEKARLLLINYDEAVRKRGYPMQLSEETIRKIDKI